MIYASFFQNHRNCKKRLFQNRMARSLLAHGLFVEYSVRFDEKMLVFGEKGKPYLSDYPGIFFNLSHCNGAAVCVIDSKPVGIDIENVRSFNERTARRVCSDSELDMISSAGNPDEMFFTLWTLKESVVKNIGVGITVPLRDFVFTFEENGNIKCSQQGFDFSLIKDRGFVISVCKTH